MLLEASSPRAQAATVARASSCRVGLQGPGQPGHAAGQRRLTAAGPGSLLEVLGCFSTSALGSARAAGQQVRVQGLAGPGLVEAGGDPLGIPEQAAERSPVAYMAWARTRSARVAQMARLLFPEQPAAPGVRGPRR